MVSHYLTTQLNQLPSDPNLKIEIRTLFQTTTQTIKSNLLSHNLQIPSQAFLHLKAAFKSHPCDSSIKAQIKSLLRHSTQTIKAEFLSANLKIAKKKHFHKKIPKKPSPEPLRFLQKQYMAEFKHKVESTREFSLKLIKEQTQRKNRQAQREQQLREQILAEIRQQELEKTYMLQNQDRIKQDQLQAMLEKTRQRKEHLRRLKEIGEREYRKAISSTPLYKKIESTFVNQFEIPELEKRKEELRKKHDLFKPMDYQELKERSKYLETLQIERRGKSIFSERSKSTKSKFLKRVLDEDKERTEQEIEKFAARRNMLEKQKHYAHIIKEIFPPAVDLLKRKEMELIKAKLSHPVTVVRKENSVDSSVSYSPKKFKKNTMVPEKREKKEPVVKDYIQEFREKRKRSMSQTELLRITDWEIERSDRKKLEKVAGIMEKQARYAERRIGGLNPLDEEAFRITEEVNGLLVNSIKTKLAILDKNLD